MDNRSIGSAGERTLMECLCWFPTLVCLVWLIIVDTLIFLNPPTEGYIGLQLNVGGILPEKVFQPALERVNFTNPFALKVGISDTKLERLYTFDEHAIRVFPPTKGGSASFPKSNDYYEGLYDDFPRSLLYNASPSIIQGKVPVPGPDGINVPVVPKEDINKFFEKAAEVRRQDVVAGFKITVIMTVIICAVFAISVIWGGYGVLTLVEIPWLFRLTHAPIGVVDYTLSALKGEPLFNSFNDNFKEFGLDLRPITLAHQDGNIVSALELPIMFGVLASLMGVIELYSHANCKFIDDETDDEEDVDLERGRIV